MKIVNWIKANLMWVVIIGLGLCLLWAVNSWNRPEFDQAEKTYKEMSKVYQQIEEQGVTDELMQKLGTLEVKAQRTEMIIYRKQDQKDIAENTAGVVYQFGLTLMLFLVFIMSLRLIPYFNTFFLGENKNLDAAERRAIYPMLGVVFLACAYLVTSTFVGH